MISGKFPECRERRLIDINLIFHEIGDPKSLVEEWKLRSFALLDIKCVDKNIVMTVAQGGKSEQNVKTRYGTYMW